MQGVIGVDAFLDHWSGAEWGQAMTVDVGVGCQVTVLPGPDPSGASRRLMIYFTEDLIRAHEERAILRVLKDEGLCHVLIIGAPVGERGPEWLALGRSALNLLAESLLRRLVVELGVERVVFAGRLNAAIVGLYCSGLFPGSVVIAISPSLAPDAEEPDPGCGPMMSGDCIAGNSRPPCAYERDPGNTVIYIENMLNGQRIHDMMAPFLGELPESMRERVVLKCGYWGRGGSPGNVPAAEWLGWTRASLTAEEVCAESLVKAYYALGVELTPSAVKSAAGTVSAPDDARSPSLVGVEQDLQWAAMVVESAGLSARPGKV